MKDSLPNMPLKRTVTSVSRSRGNSNGIFQRPGGWQCDRHAAGRLTRRSCQAPGDGQHALRGWGSRCERPRRGEAHGPASGAAHEIQAGHQPQGRQGARPHHAPGAPVPGGPGDQVGGGRGTCAGAWQGCQGAQPCLERLGGAPSW